MIFSIQTQRGGIISWSINPFEHGNCWARCDFHLHTNADKEFSYKDDPKSFVSNYVERLKEAGIRLGVITNHNKFDKDEFKALRKKARKKGMGLLPDVELSVNDGANGVHTLVVFSDEWLEDGHDYINSFLSTAFHGKTPSQYEQENGRSNDDLLTTLRNLEKFNRNFFIVFAHVEAPSGLWNEVKGGRMGDLAQNALLQKYCLGFQKVRTRDKPDAVCRTKVQQWWGDQYPAELEGCDPKALDEIGRGKSIYLQLGDLSYEAVKYALTDFHFRVSTEPYNPSHSHIEAIRFEGGMLTGKRVTFSPHLNCLIGIRGSGKSAVLESLRYALDIPLGDGSQDREYKNSLLPHVLKSGGKIVVEARDKHGTSFEISRILNEPPDVYVDGELRPGVSILGTIIVKPLYFGQKDLSAAGEGFGQNLVEKLVGDQLASVRADIAKKTETLEKVIENIFELASNKDQLQECEDELKNVNFQLEQFEKQGVQDKLSKQVEFDNDISYCGTLEKQVIDFHSRLDEIITEAEESCNDIEVHDSTHNKELFGKINKQISALEKGVKNARSNLEAIKAIKTELNKLKVTLENSKSDLKEEFAEIERGLIKALEEQGVISIKPEDYKNLSQRKTELANQISSLKKETAKSENKTTALLQALSQLNDAWHEEFMIISGALAIINEAQIALQVSAVFKGEKAAFYQKMEQTLRGHNMRKGAYEKLSQNYSDFGAIYRDIDKAALEAKGLAETFKEVFTENLHSLLTFQIPNHFEITYHGKPLKSHSLGQRASAMMLFILSQKDNDLLIIDQPEDDLDNQTIYKEVVKLLRKIKPQQQFIFATHNANFPVLGDAELIAVCESDKASILVESGSIDLKVSQKKIIDIMEGGSEAFGRRRTIYQLWNPET